MPSNAWLYAWHGFEVLGQIQEADSPPIIPIVQKPLAASASSLSPDVGCRRLVWSYFRHSDFRK